MKTHKLQPAGRRKTQQAAFTLIELLVTISIIALVLGIAGPTTIRLFSTNADTQAYNIFSTQLALARAGAIESANYVGLHSQIATSKSANDFVDSQHLTNKCMTAIVEYDSTIGFDLKTGEQPQEVPGNMAFGQVDTNYVNNTSPFNYKDTVTTDITEFTTFTILFNADGELTCNVNGSSIHFNPNSPLFAAGGTDIWTTPTDEAGVYAITMFNYLTLQSKGKTYLDESGQFLVTNVYTGRLFKRE